MLAWARAGGEIDSAHWRGLATLPERWHAPKFPLKAADFLARGIVEGPALGQALALAEDAWLAADFPLDEPAVKAIADQVLGVGFTRALLLTMGLSALALAALLLIAQRDYKRMLAYSTMEHMGLVTVGAAIGTRLAMTAVFLHIAGHGLAKAVAFITSGHIRKTSSITESWASSAFCVRNGIGTRPIRNS